MSIENIISNMSYGDEHFEPERQADWIENNPEPATAEYNDGLLTDEQLKEAIDNSAERRLLRAGYKMVWESESTDRGFRILISSWVPKNLPLAQFGDAYKETIFYQDFLLVERDVISDDPFWNGQHVTSSYYVHGEPKGYIAPEAIEAEDERFHAAADAAENNPVAGAADTRMQ